MTVMATNPPTITHPGEIIIPPDLDEQIAQFTIRRDYLSAECQGNLKQIEFLNKMAKTLHANDPERAAIKKKREEIVKRQIELNEQLTPVKAELKRLHTIENVAKRLEAQKQKELNRKKEYNRQFTARMRRIWECKGRREALKRVEQENQELLGDAEKPVENDGKTEGLINEKR